MKGTIKPRNVHNQVDNKEGHGTNSDKHHLDSFGQKPGVGNPQPNVTQRVKRTGNRNEQRKMRFISRSKHVTAWLWIWKCIPLLLPSVSSMGAPRPTRFPFWKPFKTVSPPHQRLNPLVFWEPPGCSGSMFNPQPGRIDGSFLFIAGVLRYVQLRVKHLGVHCTTIDDYVHLQP